MEGQGEGHSSAIETIKTFSQCSALSMQVWYELDLYITNMYSAIPKMSLQKLFHLNLML